MKVQRTENASGIDDIKLIAEDASERTFLRQLAEAGTLSALNGNAVSSLNFRAISVASMTSNSYTSESSIPKYNFDLRQNESKALDLTFNTHNSDPAEPLNLTQFEKIKLQIKPTKGSPALISLTVGSGLTIIGVDSNVLSIVIRPELTAILNLQEYYYDIMFSTPGSNKYYLEGKIKVSKTVTRS